MRKAVYIAIFVAAGILLRMHFQQEREREAAREEAIEFASDAHDLKPEREQPTLRFETGQREPEASRRCDGRTHCSHMTSCKEAMWFIQNCPGMEMDGDNDGIPCERQWCKHLLSK